MDINRSSKSEILPAALRNNSFHGFMADFIDSDTDAMGCQGIVELSYIVRGFHLQVLEDPVEETVEP